MKTLYESIAKNLGIGKSFYENKIKEALKGKKFFNEPLFSVPDITFKEFLDNIDVDTFACILYTCWQKSKCNMGSINIELKDGLFIIEITKMNFMGSRMKGSTWFRELFLKPEQIKNNPKNEYLFAHTDLTAEIGEKGCCSFTSNWGDRLKTILPDYIKYLKDHYEILTK